MRKTAPAVEVLAALLEGHKCRCGYLPGEKRRQHSSSCNAREIWLALAELKRAVVLDLNYELFGEPVTVSTADKGWIAPRTGARA